MSRMLFLLLLVGCEAKTITHSESKPDSTTKEQRGQAKPQEPDPYTDLTKVAGKGRKFNKDKHQGERYQTNAIVLNTINYTTWHQVTIESDTGEWFCLYRNAHDGGIPSDGDRIRCKFILMKKDKTFDGTLVWWEWRRD